MDLFPGEPPAPKTSWWLKRAPRSENRSLARVVESSTTSVTYYMGGRKWTVTLTRWVEMQPDRCLTVIDL